MRISDWSSDVCSSDLGAARKPRDEFAAPVAAVAIEHADIDVLDLERGRQPKQDELQYRRSDKDYPGARIAHSRPKLLADDGDQPPKAFMSHQSIFFRSEEHTSEPQSLMRNSYAVFCFQ